MTDTNLGLVIYVITFFFLFPNRIFQRFLGSLVGGGAKGGGRESIGELQIFSKASDGVFFFGVSRDPSSFLRSYVCSWGLGGI